MQQKQLLILVAALFSLSALSTTSTALDLGAVLEDAAKQKIEEAVTGEPAKPEPTTPTEATKVEPAKTEPAKTEPAKPAETATKPAVPVEPTKTAETTPAETKPAEPAKPAINWKSPSRDEEIAIGREITGSILGAAPLVKDDKLQKYVNNVGRWVASQSERPDLPWKFGVIESADLNAFAMPGGYVLITRGLYVNLQNEAQLAGVLGHEIAHVVKKHQLKVLQKQQLVGAGSDWLKEKFGKKNKITQKAFSTGAEISARSLDKDAEFEADSMGLVLATRAGYDAYGLPEVLHTMGQAKPSDNSVALLFKTHPHPDERLAKLGENSGNKLDKLKTGKTLETRFYKIN